jgi:hypothetical protein
VRRILLARNRFPPAEGGGVTHTDDVDLPRLLATFGGLVVMGLFAVILRWTWGTGKEHRLPDPDDPTGDGLLEEVTTVPTEDAARLLRTRLTEAGIRATVGRAGGNYRLLVFPADAGRAKLVLRSQ